MDELIKKARDFAELHHRNETRKFSSSPYFVHPGNVAKLMEEFKQTPEIIAAAYLHDIIENTTITYEDLLREFGKKVADLDLELTSDKNACDKSTKAQYLSKKMQIMSQDALTIKLGDRLDNVSRLFEADESFRNRYVKETIYILDNLNRPLTEIQLELIKRIKDKISPYL
jgi:(p)ppGpp synthase/HD superfamily hydrolase